MPQVGSIVGFKFGKQNSYDTKQKESNTLYFCDDSRRLFIGTEEYTRPILAGDELPTGDVPPNSFFILEKENEEKVMYHNKGGKEWQIVAILPAKIAASIVGENNNLSPSFGESIFIPKIEYNDRGFIINSQNQSIKLPVPEALIDQETLSFDK